MELKIYNTLTRKKEEFQPLHEGRVHIYVCGPTVYSEPHIGHAKSYVSFDVVVRYFRYLGYIVKYVQNITDVGHLTDDADEGEDKISKIAQRVKLDPMEIAQKYTWSYFDAMDALKVTRPDISPHATGHIIDQIEFIKKLVEKDFAYEVNGSVYFDVTKFHEYGKLSGRKVEELESGARIEVNPDKRNPNDFALWKKADTSHLMRWPSPWGEGYPGWHIECSAMSMKYLGETFDIHGGGLDNIFPHHECEIAQSEALTGKPFARYWMHNNMVTVKESKMGKSLGNFITIEDALLKYSSSTIRYFILSSHYRKPLDFSDEALQSAEKGIEKFLTTFKRLNELIENSTDVKNFKVPFSINDFRKSFEDSMNDDFNTPKAIAVLFDLSRVVNQYISNETEFNKSFLIEINKLYLDAAGDVLGIIEKHDEVKDLSVSQEYIDELLQVAIEVRKELRDQKLWELSDKIRGKLKGLGFNLVDQSDGSTKWEFENKS
jgi:cysteinyl-tRNA synthetase